MSNGERRFGDYRLELAERRLTRGVETVELSGRYLDALILLSAHPGALITKQRFMDEVWRGVPVTDEALTQCIRSLRRALGDDAARPRYIETVPRHGYRFIAALDQASSPEQADADGIADEGPSSAMAGGQEALTRVQSPGVSSVTACAEAAVPSPVSPPSQTPAPTPTPNGGEESLVAAGAGDAGWLLLAGAGLVGGAAAGLVGGIGYGLLAANNPPPGTGAISVVLVITCLCLLIGLLGGLGVGAGIAAARRLSGKRLFPAMAGGALGGLVIGSIGRLVGLDAFTLLVGTRPLAITGGSEGLLIGAFAGVGAWLALRRPDAAVEATAVQGAALGALAGLLVLAGGGQMMAGSLAVLAAAHPEAPLGHLLSGGVLPPGLRLLTGAVEGAVFVGALSLAFALVGRRPASSL